MKRERYEVTQKQFFLIDEELELHFEEDLAPEMMKKDERAIWYEKEGALHGPSSFFSPNATLLSQSWFVRGRQEGKAWRYYASGALYGIFRYRGGLPHLMHETFYENGQPKSSIPYDKGQLHGTVELYWPNGQVKRRVTYQHGERVGLDCLYDTEGRLIHEKHFQKSARASAAALS